jgi:precorrin-6Y C5,15-methyltransferase (decarboxylating)
MSWLSVVGIGADGLNGLGGRARKAIDRAEVLVGGERHLAMVPADGRTRLAWRSPLADTMSDLLALQPRQVAVLASGDPLWYGVGRLLLRHVPRSEVVVLPHVSAFQEACCRLGWPLEDVQTLTAHGRPVSALRRYFQPGRRLLILTTDGKAPTEIARCLANAGFGTSRTVVLEDMGGADERRSEGTAADPGQSRCFADLNLLAVEIRADAGRPALPLVPGLPDETFDHDGQLTKAEVRAVTLAALAPCDGELLWDVGAGAGSVAIEWLRSGRAMRAIAIERDAMRADRITTNAERLGVPELDVRLGEAPSALVGLADPSAIFVGGGAAIPGLIEQCWQRLGRGGRLVVNAVTLAGEQALLAFHATHGGRLLRLGIVRAEPVGGQLVWRPAMPVTQLAARR